MPEEPEDREGAGGPSVRTGPAPRRRPARARRTGRLTRTPARRPVSPHPLAELPYGACAFPFRRPSSALPQGN